METKTESNQAKIIAKKWEKKKKKIKKQIYNSFFSMFLLLLFTQYLRSLIIKNCSSAASPPEINLWPSKDSLLSSYYNFRGNSELFLNLYLSAFLLLPFFREQKPTVNHTIQVLGSSPFKSWLWGRRTWLTRSQNTYLKTCHSYSGQLEKNIQYLVKAGTETVALAAFPASTLPIYKLPAPQLPAANESSFFGASDPFYHSALLRHPGHRILPQHSVTVQRRYTKMWTEGLLALTEAHWLPDWIF